MIRKHFIHFSVFSFCLLMLSSCYIWENQPKPDLKLRSSYQIANVSQQDITLHFQKVGRPCCVYAEIYNQLSPVDVQKDNAERKVGELLVDSVLYVQSGQTVLFYKLISTDEHENMATSLFSCGYGGGFYNLYQTPVNILGDTITLSTEGGADMVVSVADKDLWEIWYKDYIYYYCWRIE